MRNTPSETPTPSPRPFTVRRLMRALPVLVMLGLVVAVSQMALPDAAGARYRECSALAEKNPALALAKAQAWRDAYPQSPVAAHCEAIALYASGQYALAARMLETLTQEAVARNSPLAAEMAMQAATADKATGRADKGIALLSSLLSHAPGALSADDRVLLLSGRARLYQASGKPLLAVQDLDHALALEPGNASAKSLLAEMLKKNNSAAPPPPDR